MRPGENGSAVISGHYGWKDNVKAAFDDLHKLTAGDLVYVQDESGAVSVFKVRGSHVYGAHENAHAVFVASDTSHVNLITCTGDWNASVQSYSGRLVVFTDKVETQKMP